ncbi:MAG TPA: recombination regulator RecX [Pseudogracilibacillus sp.]|nr:recombination regulator RecX [Pseudogracilibacillus sp.]
MHTITKVSQQKRNKNRLNIYLDGTYGLSVSDETYIKFHLYKGKQLSKEELEKIIEDDQLHQAYVLSIRYLSYRMRTEREMRLYLQKKELESFVIDKVIERLYKEKLIDDQAFANAFVNDRIERSSKGPQLIEQELREKGVAPQFITEALRKFSREKQIDRAYTLAEKELQKRSNRPYRRRLEQLQARLIRRGYPSDITREVISFLPNKQDEDEEFNLLKKEADKLYTRYKKKYNDTYELKMRMKQRLYNRGFTLDQIDSYLNSLE